MKTESNNKTSIRKNDCRFSTSSNESRPLVGTGTIFLPCYGSSINEETSFINGSYDILNEGSYTQAINETTSNSIKNGSNFIARLKPLKIAFLVLIVLFTLAAFICVDEKKEDFILITVRDDEPKYTNLTNELDIMSPVWTIKARGPFLPEKYDNLTKYDVLFTIVRIDSSGFRWRVKKAKRIPVAPSHLFQTIGSREVEFSFDMHKIDDKDDEKYDKKFQYQLEIETTQDESTPITLTISTFSELSVQGIFMSCFILILLYVLIIFEIVQRTLAAMIGATAAIACLTIINDRPSLEKVVSWLDIETLALLFGMMIMVAILCETGFFDYVAVLAFRLAHGKIWPLILLLCLFTATLSAFLDNVTTILLMTPVTIRLCEIKNIDPKHVLIAQVIFSNIGGTATPIGDPPNVIIISNSMVHKLGVDFTAFSTHVMPCVLLCIITAILMIWYMYRDVSKLSLNFDIPEETKCKKLNNNESENRALIDHEILFPSNESKTEAKILSATEEGLRIENFHSSGRFQHHSIDIKRELDVWKRACYSISGYSRDENCVREILQKKVSFLENMIKKQSNNFREIGDENFHSDLSILSEKYRIRNKTLLIKSGIVMVTVVILFFLQSIPKLDLSLGWIAILGAISILILADIDELDSVLSRVEWSTLIFFAALFVVMEALAELKLLLLIGRLTLKAINLFHEDHQLFFAIVFILWISAISSSFIDNIPFATMMVKIIEDLASHSSCKFPMTPLVYALAFGACLGGNGTLIGASANVVCSGVAEQHGYKFTFMDFFKVGFPIMLMTTAVANIYLIICHVLIGWN